MAYETGLPRQVFYENLHQIEEAQRENVRQGIAGNGADDPFKAQYMKNQNREVVPEKTFVESCVDIWFCICCWPLVCVREDRIRREYGNLDMF